MPLYSLAIFDFDGTLADSFPWFCSVLNQTAQKFGFRQVEGHEVAAFRDMHSRDIITALGIPVWKLPLIAVHMRKLAAESTGIIPLHDGALEAIERLHHGGIALAIVSSNTEDTIRRVLGPASGRIRYYSCGTSIWGKAARFKATLRALSVPPDQVISIGDEVRDIEAARKSGIAAGAVTFGYNTADALRRHNPDMSFDSFPQLCERLLTEHSPPQL